MLRGRESGSISHVQRFPQSQAGGRARQQENGIGYRVSKCASVLLGRNKGALKLLLKTAAVLSRCAGSSLTRHHAPSSSAANDSRDPERRGQDKEVPCQNPQGLFSPLWRIPSTRFAGFGMDFQARGEAV